VCELLSKELKASERFTLAESQAAADAALKVSARQVRAGTARRGVAKPEPESFSVVARLVNARGEVIWPARSRSGRRYLGPGAEVAARLVKDLLGESQKSERRRKGVR
jgi:hypothetical protein